MGRRDECVQHLKDGLSPMEIAEQMGISLGTVRSYLYQKVGEGNLKRSDILFSFPSSFRIKMESFFKESKNGSLSSIKYKFEKSGIPYDETELSFYLALRDARIALGDMYETLREIEIELHRFIRDALIEQYGPDQWWMQGVNKEIRKNCVLKREDDDNPEDPFCYVNFIDMYKIVSKDNELFKKLLKPKFHSKRKDIEKEFLRINSIRNYVMHPVKGKSPGENDFEFIKEFASKFTIKIDLDIKGGIPKYITRPEFIS